MTGLFLFALVAGAPLLVWFAFAGGDSEGIAGDADADTGVFSIVPLSTVALASTFFGLTGLLTQWIGAGAFIALLSAVGVAAVASVLNSVAFAWLRRTESSSDISDREIEGVIASVALPVSRNHRGRIVLEVGGARTQMTASPVDDSEIETGAQVIVVGVKHGVALVTRLAPELE